MICIFYILYLLTLCVQLLKKTTNSGRWRHLDNSIPNRFLMKIQNIFSVIENNKKQICYQ